MCYKTLEDFAFKCDSHHFTVHQGQLSRFITKVKHSFTKEESKYLCQSCIESCHKECCQEHIRVALAPKVRFFGNEPYECNCNDLMECQLSRKSSNFQRHLSLDVLRNAMIRKQNNQEYKSQQRDGEGEFWTLSVRKHSK